MACDLPFRAENSQISLNRTCCKHGNCVNAQLIPLHFCTYLTTVFLVRVYITLSSDASSVHLPESRHIAISTRSSNTSAPRYLTASRSIAATQARTIRPETDQRPPAPVTLILTLPPGRNRVDVSINAPPADRFTSDAGRPGRSRRSRTQSSAAPTWRASLRRSAPFGPFIGASRFWSPLGTPGHVFVRWRPAHGPHTAGLSRFARRSCRHSMYRAH